MSYERRYLGRSFGFTCPVAGDGAFIQGDLYQEPSAPGLLNAEGTVSVSGSAPIPYTSIHDLAGQRGWTGDQVGTFTRRLDRMLKTQ